VTRGSAPEVADNPAGAGFSGSTSALFGVHRCFVDHRCVRTLRKNNMRHIIKKISRCTRCGQSPARRMRPKGPLTGFRKGSIQRLITGSRMRMALKIRSLKLRGTAPVATAYLAPPLRATSVRPPVQRVCARSTQRSVGSRRPARVAESADAPPPEPALDDADIAPGPQLAGGVSARGGQ
jgi:hypothetical protein